MKPCEIFNSLSSNGTKGSIELDDKLTASIVMNLSCDAKSIEYDSNQTFLIHGHYDANIRAHAFASSISPEEIEKIKTENNMH